MKKKSTTKANRTRARKPAARTTQGVGEAAFEFAEMPPPPVAKASKAPAAPKAKAERKPSIKAQVAALLLAGGAYTVEQLLEETGAKEVTLRTALSDLKSPKYAGSTGVLAIVMQDGKYQLKGEAQS